MFYPNWGLQKSKKYLEDIRHNFSHQFGKVPHHSLSLRYLVEGRHKASPCSDILHIHSDIGSRLSTDPSCRTL